MSGQPPPVDEHAQRRREYSGPGSTLGLAALIIAVVALGVWYLEFRGTSDSSAAGGDGGIVALPAELNPTGEEPAAVVGRAAPNFRLAGLDGDHLELVDLRGGYVLINFWASWCGPCRAETPDLQVLHGDHAPAGFTVLGVNLQEPPATAQRFVDQFELRYPVVLDRSGEVANTYRVTGPPTSILVDPDGVIVEVIPGELTEDQLDAIALTVAG